MKKDTLSKEKEDKSSKEKNTAKKEVKKDKKENKAKKSKKIPKEISQDILKKMLKCLLMAVGVMVYFIVLNLAYSAMKHERLVGDIKVFAGAFLVVGLIMLEKAYKQDKGTIAIDGLEFIVLALHSLSIMHIITLFKYDFRYYLLTSSYIFSIYYVFKSIVLYTKGRKDYLSSLSDISEIVKKDDPIVKEAKKRNADSKEHNNKKENEDNKNINKVTKKEEKPKSIKRRKPKNSNKTNQEGKQVKKVEKVNKKKVKDDKQTKEKEELKEKSKESRTDKQPEKKKRGRPKKEVKKND